MDIRALRQDLQQKSEQARKTCFSEDKINVTFSGIKGEAEASRYKQLAEVLQVQVNILEAVLDEAKKMPAKKKKIAKKNAKKPFKKLATKDYDKDGTVESGTKEWEGSRDNAIKKAMSKREVSEAVVSKANRLAKKYPERAKQAKAVKEIKLDNLATEMDATSMAADNAYKTYKREGHAGNPDASAKALRTSGIKDMQLAGQYLKSVQHEQDLAGVLELIKKAKKK
jgi:hypothetical protein